MRCPRCDAKVVGGDLVYITDNGKSCCLDCYDQDDLLVELEDDKKMELNEYQKEALKTWEDGEDPKLDEVRLALGVAGEAGEVAEKFKKVLRGDKIDVNSIGKELGDVLWYITVLSDKLGMSLEQIAKDNIAKLRARQAANTIKGSGDER